MPQLSSLTDQRQWSTIVDEKRPVQVRQSLLCRQPASGLNRERLGYASEDSAHYVTHLRRPSPARSGPSASSISFRAFRALLFFFFLFFPSQVPRFRLGLSAPYFIRAYSYSRSFLVAAWPANVPRHELVSSIGLPCQPSPPPHELTTLALGLVLAPPISPSRLQYYN